jgi:hypothetical protein
VPDPVLLVVGALAVVSAWCVVAALRELREVFRAR